MVVVLMVPVMMVFVPVMVFVFVMIVFVLVTIIVVILAACSALSHEDVNKVLEAMFDTEHYF